MKKYKDTAKKFAEEIQFPEDAFCDTFSIEIKSNTEIIIEGCKGMVEYDTTQIAVNLGSMIVRISGDCLEISNFSDQQVTIKGIIISVSFSS